jgi:hypothetical protein
MSAMRRWRPKCCIAANDAMCQSRPSLRRRKAKCLFAVSDEAPYGTRCRVRALFTASRDDAAYNGTGVRKTPTGNVRRCDRLVGGAEYYEYSRQLGKKSD